MGSPTKAIESTPTDASRRTEEDRYYGSPNRGARQELWCCRGSARRLVNEMLRKGLAHLEAPRIRRKRHTTQGILSDGVSKDCGRRRPGTRRHRPGAHPLVFVDANVLVYAHVLDFAQREHARAWLDQPLNRTAQVELPWPRLLAFLRLVANPRDFERPASSRAAWHQIEESLDWQRFGFSVRRIGTDRYEVESVPRRPCARVGV